MKKILSLVFVFIALLSVTGCAQNYGQAAKDIRGKITQLSPGDGKGILGVTLIEGILEKDTKVDKAQVTITSKTDIMLLEDGNKLQKADYSSLKEGQTVEAIFSGPVRESYPVQATAKAIIIRAQGEAEGVELETDKTTYQKGETMNLTIKNNSTAQISLGRPYKIEQLKSGKWSEYPLELAFTLELILLEPGETFEQTVPLEKLEPGEYRLSKSIGLGSGDAPWEAVREFTIQ